jgi:peptidoglycan/xylan/chitin deacetylase (PgdA/CDA1 family)
VRAKHYVLAAGGTENPRLLLLSNHVASRGLGNEHDLVGRYFMEHPHTERKIIVPRRRISSALYGLGFRNRAIAARLALPAELQEREQLLNYSGNIEPVYFGHTSAGWLAFRKLVLSLSRSRSTDPFIRYPPYGRKGLSLREVGDVVRQFDRVTVAAFLQLFQPEGFNAAFVLESKPEQAPNPESRLVLDHARDAFGLNRIKLDWRMLPIDRRTTVRAEEIIEGELRRLGIGSLAPLGPGDIEGWPANLHGGWHQIGMTRMHEDPRRGVVDATGRVHGMANLFITGSSIFPTAGAAPPTLTIVALAMRLADHLQHRVFAEPPTTVMQCVPAVPANIVRALCRPLFIRPLPDHVAIYFHTVEHQQLTRFREALGYWKDMGYTVMRAIDFSYPRQHKCKSIFVSFDDNYRNWLTLLPMLSDLGVKSTFFINTRPFRDVASQREIEDFFKRVKYYGESPTLSTTELKEMISAGHTIGCHSHSHLDLTRLRPGDWDIEIAGSKRILEELAGCEIVDFSFPFGMRRHFSNALRRYCNNLGFKTISTAIPALQRERSPKYIHRNLWDLRASLEYNLENIRIDGRMFTMITGRSAVG